jgi:hypothetical protein
MPVAMPRQDLTPRQPSLPKQQKRRFALGPKIEADAGMIDIFTVVMPHLLMAIAVWRLLHDDTLDNDPILPVPKSALASRKTKTPMRGQDTPGA